MNKCVLLLLLLLSSECGYTQTENSSKGDTFYITEGKIVDSTVIRLLDSAFLFLKLPPLEFNYPYCYVLSFTQDPDIRLKEFYDVELLVANYFLYDIDNFNEKDKFFIHYKGVQILIFPSQKSEDNIGLYKYIEPTASKSTYYSNHDMNSNKVNLLDDPKVHQTKQTVSYGLDTRINKILFGEYKLNIYGGGFK